LLRERTLPPTLIAPDPLNFASNKSDPEFDPDFRNDPQIVALVEYNPCTKLQLNPSSPVSEIHPRGQPTDDQPTNDKATTRLAISALRIATHIHV